MPPFFAQPVGFSIDDARLKPPLCFSQLVVVTKAAAHNLVIAQLFLFHFHFWQIEVGDEVVNDTVSRPSGGLKRMYRAASVATHNPSKVSL